MLDNIKVSFMSFSPDAVKHLLESVPAAAVCQLVDDVNVAEIREELRLGALTGGALANVMKAAQAEGERILAAGEAGMAGPGIGYVRAFPGTVERWIGSGRRVRVWTVDAEDDVERCRELGVHEITTNWPAQVLAQLMTDRQPLR
jgi:glycerophosphoryl diester phosphodiesterase